MFVSRKRFERLERRVAELESTVDGQKITISNVVNDSQICSWEPCYKEDRGFFSISYQQQYKTGDVVKKILEHLGLKIEKYPECIGLVKETKK